MKIAIGSDHAGFTYKETIKQLLAGLGYVVNDFGTDSEEPVDYPLFIRPVALAVARGEAERGVVLGGSGNGEAMAANRVKGVRCALCWNLESARLARQHNDANIIFARAANAAGGGRFGDRARVAQDAFRRRASSAKGPTTRSRE